MDNVTAERGPIKIDMPQRASAGPTISLIFSTICLLYWIMLVGIADPASAVLISIIQIAMFPAYITGALNSLKMGDGVSGNMFLVFASWFGIGGGALGLITALAPSTWTLDPKFMGIFWLVSGLFLLFNLYPFRKLPWTFFVMILFAAVALLLLGLMYLGILQGLSVALVAGWLLFAVAVLGIYGAMADYFALLGVNLPKGKGIIK